MLNIKYKGRGRHINEIGAKRAASALRMKEDDKEDDYEIFYETSRAGSRLIQKSRR